MDHGLTQRTLAERLGCSYQSVARWERDLSEALAVRSPAIEKVLGPGLVPEQGGVPGRVRAARLWLGLTQEEPARQAGVDPRTARHVETGRHRPSRCTWERLRETLGLPWQEGGSAG
jgi:transcriptional regulator with XRE-family HTH domain